MGNTNIDETAQADWSNVNKLGVINACSNRKTELKYFSTLNGRNPNDRLILFVDKLENENDFLFDKPFIDSTKMNQTISYT